MYVFDSRALEYDESTEGDGLLRFFLMNMTIVGFDLGEDVKLLHQNHKITPKKTIDLAVSLPPHPTGHSWGVIGAAQQGKNIVTSSTRQLCPGA